ncbi:three component ABC system middle component [Pseudomonas aeruginosa]
MERGCIAVADDGRIQTIPKKVRKAALMAQPETVARQKVARVVGKEFANIADRATVYT